MLFLLASLMEKNSDQNLVSTIQKGSQAAFHILYDKYSPSLLGFINKIVMNNEAAENIFQKAFCEIWKRKQSFNASKGKFFIWMLQIARQVTTEAIRSGKIIYQSEIEKLQHCVFYAALEPLVIGKNVSYPFVSDKEKAALQLVYFKGYSIIEASAEMGITIEALACQINKVISLHKEAATA